jgi:hypothetical protein
MKLLIMEFSPTCIFILLGSKYLPELHVLEHPQSLFSLIRNTTLHTNIKVHPEL